MIFEILKNTRIYFVTYPETLETDFIYDYEEE